MSSEREQMLLGINLEGLSSPLRVVLPSFCAFLLGYVGLVVSNVWMHFVFRRGKNANRKKLVFTFVQQTVCILLASGAVWYLTYIIGKYRLDLRGFVLITLCALGCVNLLHLRVVRTEIHMSHKLFGHRRESKHTLMRRFYEAIWPILSGRQGEVPSIVLMVAFAAIVGSHYLVVQIENLAPFILALVLTAVAINLWIAMFTNRTQVETVISRMNP